MVKDQSGTVDQRFGRQLIYNTLQRLSSIVFRNRYRAHLSLSMRKKAQRFGYIFHSSWTSSILCCSLNCPFSC